MDFYTKYRDAAFDGDIVKVAEFVQKYGFAASKMRPIIQDIAGMENRTDILSVTCVFCIVSGAEVDPDGTALFNSVLAKQRKNVNILLEFGACYTRIQFDSVYKKTLFHECLSDMNLEIVGCNKKTCKSCNDTEQTTK